MRTIGTVMSTVKYDEIHLEKLKKSFEPAEFILVDDKDADAVAKALGESDVAVLANDGIDTRLLLESRKLKWVHVDRAGMDQIAKPEVFAKGLILTGSAGRSGPALAEHAVYFMLDHVYHSDQLYAAQTLHQWGGIRGQRDFLSLCGQTVGIIGLGNTGKELAVRAKALGMNVLAYRRRSTEPPEGVDTLYCAESGGSIDELIRESDFIVLAMTLSDKTYHMIGKRELDMMKPSAYLVNVARGSVVDEKALIDALKEGRIGGAGLDTFGTEPLPPESPLWDLPNVRITPHMTPHLPDRIGRAVSIIAENVRRYRNEEPLLNRITAEDLYSK